jgi:beta-phosphoglucomutase-like phosphatase (HAD superfamily)
MVGMGSNLNLTCKALLFDMDGTLVDSTGVVKLAWSWLAGRHEIVVLVKFCNFEWIRLDL